MNARKLTLMTLATLCALTGVLALASTSALAVGTHVFSKSFGGGPCVVAPLEPCEGRFSEPEGVAVNESTGDVYVVDRGNDRIEYFSAEGGYKGEFNGSGENAVEKVAAPTGRVSSPESIAIDNAPGSPSFGDVYVADQGHSVIDKFSPTGAYIGQLTESAPGTPLSAHLAVAVSSSGVLWVEQIRGTTKLATIFNFSDARANAYINTRVTIGLAVEYPGFAVDSNEDLYINSGYEPLSRVTKYNSFGELLIDKIDSGPVTAIAVESSDGSSYVDNVGSIARFTSNGFLSERFGSEQLTSGSGIAVSSSTGDVYVADVATDLVDVYINKPSKPNVEGEAFSKVTAHSATLSAEVNTVGLETTYAIEYGTSEAYGSTINEAPLAGSFAGSVAVSVTSEGVLQPETTYHFRVVATNEDGTTHGADVTFTTLSSFTGLPDGRGYELVSPVANADGNVYKVGYGALACGECAYGSLRASADGNAVEYVADPLATGGTGNPNLYVATHDSGGGWSSADLATPGFDGAPFEALFSNELSNSGTSVVPAGSHSLSEDGQGLFDSVGGRLVRVSVLPEGTVASDAKFGSSKGDLSHVISADGSRIFWTDLEEGPDKEHVFVRENDDRTVPVSAGAATFGTASSDGRYVFYTENGSLYRFDVQAGERLALTPASYGATGTGNLSHAVGTGDVTKGSSVISGVRTTGGVFAAGQNLTIQNCLNSETGLANSFVGYKIIAILNPTEIEIDGGVPISCKGAILIGKTNEITSVATAAGRFQVGESVHGPGIAEGTRINEINGNSLVLSESVTAQGTGVTIVSGGPEVLGVIGVNETGEDGAYAYFVANAVLGDGAERGAVAGNCTVINRHARRGEANCNLYVRHDGVTTFIAALTPNDIEEGNGIPVGVSTASLAGRTGEVASGGHAVVFLSYARLTGYDNQGCFTEETGGCREAYVYNADTGRLSCASCNPIGTLPTEIPTPLGTEEERFSEALPVSGDARFMHRWISGDGARVFFESSEALVAQDTNGKIDVYEWERDGSGSCQNVKGCVYLLSGGSSIERSYLLDASASGDDVFMITRAQLVSQDQGETYEVYDARVGAVRPVEEPVCTGTGCQGLPSAPPLFATPSSVTFNGVGNFSSSSVPAAKPKPRSKPAKCRKGFRRDQHNRKCVKTKAKRSKARKSIHGKGSK